MYTTLYNYRRYFPTLLEVIQVKNYKVPQVVDGKSFLKDLGDNRVGEESRPLYRHSPNNWYTIEGNGYGASSAIRVGDWKLIYTYKTGKKRVV